MTELTLQLPDELAERIGRSGRWAPAILGLGLDGYGTRAAAVANVIFAFLSTNPSASAVLDYHVSEAAQDRLHACSRSTRPVSGAGWPHAARHL